MWCLRYLDFIHLNIYYMLYMYRRATAVPIDLRGVTRPMSYINGVYEPTNESCFGWPVYKKQSSDNQVRAEYIVYM